MNNIAQKVVPTTRLINNAIVRWEHTRLLALAILIGAGLFLSGCATPAGEIETWSITDAEKAEFSGKVVDVLCEVNKNCVDNCGDGGRQLGIKTEDKGTVLVSKNLTNYSGAADELLPFCNKVVDVNGLFTAHKGVRFFQIQNVRTPGGQWRKATHYLNEWAERSGKPPSNNWQNQDERVKDILERDGRLGLGLEADNQYFK